MAILVAGTAFMEILDGTVIATAAPAIAQSFGVAAVDIGIAMTAYMLTIAVCIPVSGQLAERWGVRRVFLCAIAVFTVASVLCALSTSLAMLTAMRVLQAVGGAMMVPVGRFAVLRNTEKRDMMRAVAYLTWPALLAPVLAPVIGGAIVTLASWHWIFLVNVPLGIAAFLAAVRVVPAEARTVAARTLDWPGFVLIGVTIAALTVGADSLWSRPVVGSLAAAAVAVVFGVAAWWHLRRTARPLLDFTALRTDTFRVSTVAGNVYRATIFTAPFMLPLMFQDGFGWDPFRSGLVVAAVFVGNLAIKPVTTPLMRWLGFRTVLLVNTVCVALTFVGCAFLTAGTPLPLMLAVLFVSGAFRSIGFTAYNTMTYADIPSDRLSGANTLSATVQQVAAGMGVALGALAVQAGTSVESVNPDDSALAPYRFAFLLVAGLLLVTLPPLLRLRGDAGAEVTGRLRERVAT
ncbi:MFS transporter [Rhodococcus sp. NPDC003318]|uniref:MFS transporter n=1 Tax=Rhodococcus sp. NPDC003318 TaxID=3364503 RepID=UPI0036A8573F